MARNRNGRRTLAALTFVAVLLAPSIAAGAGNEEVIVAHSSPFSFGFGVSPRTLPHSEPAPAKLLLQAEFASPTGSPHPPPASKVTVALDRFFDLSTEGLPACAPSFFVASSLERATPKDCKPARVGQGKIEVSFAFPGNGEKHERLHALLYNGGTRGIWTRLWVYARLGFPMPSPAPRPD